MWVSVMSEASGANPDEANGPRSRRRGLGAVEIVRFFIGFRAGRPEGEARKIYSCIFGKYFTNCRSLKCLSCVQMVAS